MNDILKKISRVDGVRAAVLAGLDGLVIASVASDSEESGSIGAAAASMAASFGQAGKRLGQGAMKRFILRGPSGSAVGMLLQETVLLTLLKRDANMGMVLVELRDLGGQLQQALAPE